MSLGTETRSTPWPWQRFRDFWSGCWLDKRLVVSPAGRGWLGAALLLLAIGLVTVYSASFYRAVVRGHSEYYFVSQQFIGAGLGLFALALATRIDPRRWIDLAPPIYGATVLFLLLVWSPIGIAKGGADRWIDLGVVRFQSSELAKIAVPLLLIWYLRRYGDLGGKQTRLRVHVNCLLILWILFAVGLVLLQPDLGTALFILGVGFALILCSGTPVRYSLGLGLLASPLLGWQLHERWDLVKLRFAGLINSDEAGTQISHALNAIRSGGIEGAGIGRGTEKTLYLYAEFSDFIFAVFAEETGLLGIALLLLLYVSLLIYGWRVIHSCRDFHLRLLGIAIVCNLIVQALINLAVNTATAPTKGIALPLISHGSTGLTITLFQVGILVAISRLQSQLGDRAAVDHPSGNGET